MLVVIALSSPSLAAARPPLTTHHSPLTIVVVDRIDFRDLLSADAPTLKRLMNEGAVGLISPRVAGALTSESACVTIGAGAPAVADESARRACNLLMPREGDRSETGPHFDLVGVLHEGMRALQRLNRREATLAQPGLLGTVLHRHHLKTGVVDGYPSPRGRDFGQVTTIAADERGSVDSGYTGGHGGFTIYDNGQVYPESIEEDLGDARLRVLHPSATFEAAAQKSRRATLAALHQTDTVLREWLKLVDLRRTRLMILTPCPRTNQKYFPRLAPVIMVGKGVKRGVLTSPSTRQRGLVTLADIAPTVLKYFNIPKDERMVGQPMAVLPSQNPVGELKRLDEWVAARNRVVTPVAVLIAAWQTLATALGLLGVWAYRRMGVWAKDNVHTSTRPHVYTLLCHFALLGAVALPLSALLISPFATWGTASVIALMIVVTCVFAAMSMCIKKATVALQLVAALAVLTLVVDALGGGRLVSTSIIGNSFATGMRFYGIGNDYAGYLIATALIAAGLSRSFEDKKRWFPWAGLLSLTVVLGSARWGANFGAASTAAVACAVAMVKMRSARFGWQQVVLVALMATGAIAAVVGFELLRAPEAQSHLGRAFTQVEHEGGEALLQIARRKWQMNWRLIQFTPFNYLMLAVIPVLAAALHYRRGALKSALAQRRAFDACMVGGVVGVVTALVTNDSGVVMVGIMLGTLVPALLLAVHSEGTVAHS